MKKMLPRHFSIMVPLLFVLAVNAIAHSFFMMTFPIIGRTLNLEDWHSGAVLSLSAFSMLLVSPMWGKYIDKKGQKFAINIGIASTFLFFLAIGFLYLFIPSLSLSAMSLFTLFLSIRIFQSMAVAGLMPAAQSLVASETEHDTRVSGMGLLGAMFGIGSIVGGSLAMTFGVEHYTEALFSVAAMLFLSYFFVATKLRDIDATDVQFDTSFHPPKRFSLIALLPFLLITFISIFVYGLLQQTLGLRLQDTFHYSAQDALKSGGGLLILTMVVMAITQMSISVVKRLSPFPLLLAGILGSLSGLVLLAIATDLSVMMIAMGVIGAGMGMLFPANLALISFCVPASQQAYAASINIVSKGIGLAIAPLLGAILYGWNNSLPIWISIVFVGSLLIVLLKLPTIARLSKAEAH